MNAKFFGKISVLFFTVTFLLPHTAHATPISSQVEHSENISTTNSYYSEILSESAYIISPQELEEMGYSEEIIHQQKEALKALPVFVKNQNDETTETQQSITHKYRAQSVHENSRIGILNKTQSSLRNTYQIRNTSGETFHFRQKGVFDVNVRSAKTVSPGFGKGRVMYHSLESSLPTAKVWTVWRENTNQEFEMPYRTHYSSRVYPSIEKIERYSLAQ
ncbi:hypothetical protein [Rothia nasimurium]|uniref:hypothetical protein n=1 Tax=Rothia nasimurium TaxID=85336 RepID=UPI001F3E2DEB|nr:hypothetical protein [Rothia nasimurium]